CWQGVTDATYRMWLQPQRCIQFTKAYYVGDFAQVSEAGKLILGLDPKREVAYSLNGDTLEINGRNGKHTLKKLAKVPDECAQVLQPLKLGAAEKLPAERIKAICAEIQARHDKDQEARQGDDDDDDAQKREKKMQAVDLENHAWMKKLVQEIGWIDADRFGQATEHQAWLMMMHYVYDWPLILAVLPEIKKDVLAKKFNARLYSMLYDRLCGVMGRKSYYGQVTFMMDRDKAEFGPFEDFSKVDEYRKEIGLSSVEAEIEKFKKENPRVELKLIKE
ncbi:MAG TPA: DUF6624 domain-containing protein, partial [Planctomycetota bacterium]|nr:DUF6624 domain-containing protein [Planctomycetota bacterium]